MRSSIHLDHRALPSCRAVAKAARRGYAPDAVNLSDVPKDDIPAAVAYVVSRGALEEEDVRVLFERQTSDRGRSELARHLVEARLADPGGDAAEDEEIDIAARRASGLLVQLRDLASQREITEEERVVAWSRIATWNRAWPRQASRFLDELAAIGR